MHTYNIVASFVVASETSRVSHCCCRRPGYPKTGNDNSLQCNK